MREVVLREYQIKLESWRENRMNLPEMRVMNVEEVSLLILRLHPTNNRKSKEASVRLIKALVEMRIALCEDLVETLKVTPAFIWKKIKILRQMGLVRRESRVFYLTTPKMDDFFKNYLHLLGN